MLKGGSLCFIHQKTGAPFVFPGVLGGNLRRRREGYLFYDIGHNWKPIGNRF